MIKSVPNAFTLIELLVVISIMALIATVTLANYQSFGEEQKLKNASLDIQSQLRTAQTNATTNLKCNTESSATWQVEFADSTTTNLKCQEPSAPATLKKTLKLDTNIILHSVSGVGAGCPIGVPFTISFAPLSGSITPGAANCTSLMLNYRNTKTGSFKSLIIEQGGRIHVP